MASPSAGRICFVIGDNPNAFYRTLLPASELAKRGFDVSVVREPNFRTLLAFDAVVLETPFTAQHYELIRRLKGKVHLAMDLDDNFHEIEKTNPRYARLTAARAAITRVIESVDELIVATEALKDFYGAFNERIAVLPNMIPTELFVAESGGLPRPGPLRIGWHGGFSHDADLKILKAVLPAVHKEFSDIRFIFFGNAPRLGIPNAEYVDSVPFSAFPAALARQRLDIGMAPLVDTPFNRCKTNLKWLEYSALEIPAVASDVRPYSRSIEHGVDGFLAKTPEDWIRDLRRLILDPGLRRDVGRRAHESAIRRFNCGEIGDRYAELALRWPAKSEIAARPARPRFQSAGGLGVFLVALLGTIAVLIPPFMIHSLIGPAAAAPTARLLVAVLLSQGLTIATVFAAVRACLAIHHALPPPYGNSSQRDAERGLADFLDYHRLRPRFRRSSLEALAPASVLMIAGLIALSVLRRQNHPSIFMTLLCAGLAETGAFALIFASSYYLTSLRFPDAKVLPLEQFLRH